jgi:probable F420-dependent oxidoreductase
MLPGRIGLWTNELRKRDPQEIADCAAEIEQLGYTAMWLPRFFGQPAPPPLHAALDATSELVVATGILSVWSYDATDVARMHVRLNEDFGGRFLLGLGISHAPIVDWKQPGRYRKPLTTMRAYLEQLDAADDPVPHDEIVLAALGPKMLQLAADSTGGAHPYFVPPEHTRIARQTIGPSAYLAPEQTVLFETDPARAREIAREFMAVYLPLPNYRNNLNRLGFGDDDLADGGNDRLVDAIVAWGDGDAIAARVQEHFDAGADHVCVQPLDGTTDEPQRGLWRTCAELLGLGA